jgi:hypothetical protein
MGGSILRSGLRNLSGYNAEVSYMGNGLGGVCWGSVLAYGHCQWLASIYQALSALFLFSRRVSNCYRCTCPI